MKLLFDQNLAPRLVDELKHLISKDADFHQMSLVHGAPPKVVWIRLGNCTTGDVVRLLEHHHRRLLEFDDQPETAFLALR